MPFENIETLFGAALALPASEREAYLQRACADDGDAYATVRRLLDSAQDASAFVKEPIDVNADSIEGYELINELGEGGGGVVYRARQLTPVTREVALKILKLGMDTKAVIHRFEAERQTLALMHHPHIAQVLDAGATRAGRPYFVMELVRGVPITTYCEQCGLTIEERLELCMQVCEAIHHAHEKGIVHRDIKPSNVLVTLHGGRPFVKVIDFGIAKAMQGHLTDQTLYTALDQFLGTPAYVSPEQTELNAEVDARSDVYSLGVLLYELLTGFTPFDSRDLISAGIDEMRRRIRFVEPPRPSRKLDALTRGTLTRTDGKRELAAARSARKIKGELDWIVMRCLEKERARRYRSAHELASDLHRYLRNEPVLARAPSTLYSIAKLARRKRAAFAATLAIALAIVAGAIVSAWQAIAARRAEAVAQEVIDFLRYDLLARAGPQNEPDRDITLRTVLDRAADALDGRFDDEPLAEAAIRSTLADTYDQLGEYETAERHYLRAAELYRRSRRTQSPQALDATSRMALTINNQGRSAEAEPLANGALRAQEAVLGEAHEQTLATMRRLGQIYQDLGRYAEAEQVQSRAVALSERTLGAEHAETMNAMHDLALTYAYQSRFAHAEALQTQLLERFEGKYGSQHPDTLMAMNNLSHTYSQQGKYEGAAELQRRTIELAKHVLGADHPDLLLTMSNLASNLEALGDLPGAERLQLEVLEARTRRLGPNHPDTLVSMNNLAATYREQRRYSEAEALQSKAVSAATDALGPKHATTLAFRYNLAFVNSRQGRLARAEELFSAGFVDAREALGAEHLYASRYAEALAGVLIERRKFLEAVPLLQGQLDAQNGRKGWLAHAMQSRLGEALAGLGRFSEAERHAVDGYRGLVRERSSLPASRRSEPDDAMRRVVRIYIDWGKPEQAAAWRLEHGA